MSSWKALSLPPFFKFSLSQAEAHAGAARHILSTALKHPLQQLQIKHASDNLTHQTMRPLAPEQQNQRGEQTAKTSVHWWSIINGVNSIFLFGMFQSSSLSSSRCASHLVNVNIQRFSLETHQHGRVNAHKVFLTFKCAQAKGVLSWRPCSSSLVAPSSAVSQRKLSLEVSESCEVWILINVRHSCSFGNSVCMKMSFTFIGQLENVISITQVEQCCWCRSWPDEVWRALRWCGYSEEGTCPDQRRGCCMAAPQTGGYSLHMLEEAVGNVVKQDLKQSLKIGTPVHTA